MGLIKLTIEIETPQEHWPEDMDATQAAEQLEDFLRDNNTKCWVSPIEETSDKCIRCGSLLTEHGFCSGYITPTEPTPKKFFAHGRQVCCGFGRHLQTCPRGWCGDKDHPEAEDYDSCGCPRLIV